MYRPNPPHLYNARIPLVSVLLPVHNTSATLGAALDSLLAQSLPDFEVVAQDDGTLALLQAYAQRDARVRPLPQVLLHWRDDPARATRADARYAVKNFLRAKAHYLLAGPLHNRERVIMWVAGQMARCLAKHLKRAGAQVAAFSEVNPQKYRTQLRGAPIQPTTILRAACSQPAAADSGGCSCGRPARHHSQPLGRLELARDN